MTDHSQKDFQKVTGETTNDCDSLNHRFCVVVLSGPSGSGKTTIVDRLVNRSPIPLVKAISATTRLPRTGEVDGENYYFLSSDEFEQQRLAGKFLEYAEVYGAGHWYGTLHSELERIRQQQGWAFLEIDVQGALRVMQEYPGALTIFLTTPSPEEYERRLRNRGTETEEVIQRRLATAASELELASHYKHTVINDDLDRAVDEILEIFSEAGEFPLC